MRLSARFIFFCRSLCNRSGDLLRRLLSPHWIAFVPSQVSLASLCSSLLVLNSVSLMCVSALSKYHTVLVPVSLSEVSKPGTTHPASSLQWRWHSGCPYDMQFTHSVRASWACRPLCSDRSGSCYFVLSGVLVSWVANRCYTDSFFIPLVVHQNKMVYVLFFIF